jgi:hypothetical protein
MQAGDKAVIDDIRILRYRLLITQSADLYGPKILPLLSINTDSFSEFLLHSCLTLELLDLVTCFGLI